MVLLRSLVLTLFLFAPVIASAADPDNISDPFERWNRGVFWFNDRVDRYFLEPVAEGYDFVVPDLAQEGVNNVFRNLRYPSFLVSDIIQFKFDQAAVHTGRFFLNTTLGIGGLLDVAQHFGLEEHEEDFGTALAYRGVPAGPYLVFPLLGPTTVRDGAAGVFDRFLDPVYWIAYETMDETDATILGLSVTALEVVQRRADLLDAIDAAREASVDYYLFVQSAYYQDRHAVINDLRTTDTDPFADEDPFDDEFEEEFEEELEEEGVEVPSRINPEPLKVP